MPSRKPVVMCLSGLDPTGGAGIQADIETLLSLGCHAAPVVTALTVQDSQNVMSVSPCSADYLHSQARAILADMKVDAFKLGLMPNIETMEVIHQLLKDNPDLPVILDPILAAGGGFKFGDQDIVSALREFLIPQATVITPNSNELKALTDNTLERGKAVTALLNLGCDYALVTGTHDSTKEVVNTLYSKHQPPQTSSWTRLRPCYHGSGCTLASAIAGKMSSGYSVQESVQLALRFTWKSLEAGFKPGAGQHFPDRAYLARQSQDSVS